jgi:hypothetical protein
LLLLSPIPWLPTPPPTLINGNYSCPDGRTLSSVQSPDFNRSNLSVKRNQSSLSVDESYHLYQIYQGDNLQKCITPTSYQQHSVRKKNNLWVFFYLIKFSYHQLIFIVHHHHSVKILLLYL